MTIRLSFLMAFLWLTPGMTQTSDFEEISFETADGGQIFGNLYGEASHGVVLAHGAVFDKESWDHLARRLADAGLKALAIDFRGYGKSRAGRDGRALHEDVLGAVRYLRDNGTSEVSVIGASMGGGAAGQAAAEAGPADIDRLILLAAVANSAPEQMTGRKLFIVAEGDGLVGSVRRQYERATEPKELVVLPGNAHAQHIFNTEHAERLRTLIIDWLTAE